MVVQVVDYSNSFSQKQTTGRGTKYDYKNFMVSHYLKRFTLIVSNGVKGNKVENHLDLRSYLEEMKKVAATLLEKSEQKGLSEGAKRKEKAQDEEDDKNDKELMDLLKTTQLINDYTASELVGKDRRKHIQNKLAELGGKNCIKPPKVSLPIYLGMKKKASERVEKQVQQAKDFGIYIPSMKKEFIKKEVALNRGKAAAFNNMEKRKIDKGIIGSVGRLRQGVMKVSKKVIESVENRGTPGKGKNKKKSNSKGFKLSY